MQATRQEILDYLRDRGEGGVRELAAHLQLTATGVRQHLTILEREGYVTSREVRGRVGRPALAYSLTDGGEALFPKRYPQLAIALIAAARDALDDATFDRLVEQAAEPLGGTRAEEIAHLAAGERVAAACGMLRDWDLVVDWERTPDGAFLIHERSCPYIEVARQSSATCAIEVALIERLTGMPTALERCQVRGADHCTYRLAPGDGRDA